MIFSGQNTYDAVLGLMWGFLDGSDGKESACNAGDPGSKDLGVGKIPWRTAWQPTPILLPGEFQGQKSLVATVHGVTKSQT